MCLQVNHCVLRNEKRATHVGDTSRDIGLCCSAVAMLRAEQGRSLVCVSIVLLQNT